MLLYFHDDELRNEVRNESAEYFSPHFAYIITLAPTLQLVSSEGAEGLESARRQM